MNKTIKKTKEATNFVSDLQQNGQVNGNFSNDSLITLYEEAKSLRKAAKSFEKDFLKSKIRERARKGGMKNSKGYSLLVGDEYTAQVYQRSSSRVDFDGVKEFFLSQTNDEETVEQLFTLLKKSGFSKTSIRDAIEEGQLPADLLEKQEMTYEDHKEGNYINTTERS